MMTREGTKSCGIFDRTFAVYSSLVSFFIPLVVMLVVVMIVILLHVVLIARQEVC